MRSRLVITYVFVAHWCGERGTD